MTLASKNTYDVVIIGGAVIGSSAAYFLASNQDFRGSILVIERDWSYAKCATALSSSSIRHQFSNAINVEMSLFGTQFLRQFHQYLQVDGDVPELGFKEHGYLFLASAAADRLVLEQNHAVQMACGANVCLLDQAALAHRFKWLNTADITMGSLGESGEGWFDSVSLMRGFRQKARSLGVEYIEDEVCALERVGNRIVGVTTKGGQQIRCDNIINAAGTRGARVASMGGMTIPVEPRRRSLFVVSCPTRLEGVVPLTIDPTGVFFRPEGRYFLAGTYPKYDPEVDPDDFDVMHEEFEQEIWPTLAERVPAFEALRVVSSWAGHYDYCTLDHNAIVGSHPEISNFYFANGFSGHGLQQSPAVGRALSELICHGEFRTLDLSALGYDRITTNTPFVEMSIV